MNNNYLEKILKITYYILVIGIIYFSFILLKELCLMNIIIKILEVLIPLFIGFFIAWTLNPLVIYLCRNNFNRRSSTVIIYIIITIILYLIISLLIPLLSKQINEFINNLPKMINDISYYINKYRTKMNIIDLDDIYLKTSDYLLSKGPPFLISIAKDIIAFLGLFFIGLIIGFYLLLNFNKINKYFNTYLSKLKNKNIKPLIKKINKQMYLYIKGTILSSSILFVTSLIFYLLIGIYSPVLLALFCAITNIIPFIGPYIGGIPVVLIGLTKSSSLGFISLLVVVGIQLIESNIITPIIMSKSMKLHPVTIIVSLLLFGSFFGIIGMILAVPVVSIIKIIINKTV